MNPPYSHNLHLDILQTACAFGANIVNLSPATWICDPLSEYKHKQPKKHYKQILKDLKQLEIVPMTLAQEHFQSTQYADLGIYCIGNFPLTFDPGTFRQPLIEKIYSQINSMLKMHEKKKADGYSCRMPYIHGNVGRKDWADIVSPSYDIFCDPTPGGINTTFVNFATEAERRNLFDSLWTDFMRYIDVSCKVSIRRLSELPWLGDLVNPRTGLTGYESNWTDDDLFEYFGLTDEERKAVHSTVQPYN